MTQRQKNNNNLKVQLNKISDADHDAHLDPSKLMQPKMQQMNSAGLAPRKHSLRLNYDRDQSVASGGNLHAVNVGPLSPGEPGLVRKITAVDVDSASSSKGGPSDADIFQKITNRSQEKFMMKSLTISLRKNQDIQIEAGSGTPNDFNSTSKDGSRMLRT